MESTDTEVFEVDATVAVAGRGGEVLPPFETSVGEPGEHAARGDLRRQIARMEAELGRLFGSAFPRKGIEWGVGAPGGPRLLDVAELETVRDALAFRLADARAALAEIAESEQAHRALIEGMVDDPAAHKWVRVRSEAIGERSCRSWHARPRWGVLGMLAGWWQVKLSSGCPLAEGHGARRAPKRRVGTAHAVPRLMASKKRKRRKQRPRPSPRPGQPPPARAAAKPAAAARKDGPPPALWGSFPLSETVVAIGLVLLIGGLFLPPAQGKLVVGVGLVLASLAGLELSIREHFSGYRSHTALLAGACGVAAVALALGFGHRSLSIGVALAIGVGAGALAAAALIMSFRRRSGGASFRLR